MTGVQTCALPISFCSRQPWAVAGHYVRLSVSDTGTGVPPELQDHIFEPFFTTKEIGKGTGLGLATVYGIVKQHDGTIQLAGDSDSGAVFHIYLPALNGSGDDAGERDVEGEEKTALHGDWGMGGATILVAEDDPHVRDMAVHILESAGYRTLVAQDGAEAQEMFSKAPDTIDLAFLDVVMPKVSGRAVADFIRSVRPDIPILLCTGYDFNILGSSLNPGSHFELIKTPYDRLRLIYRIREILAAGE